MTMAAPPAILASYTRKAIAALSLAGLALAGCSTSATAPAAQDAAAQSAQSAQTAQLALPSWRDGATRQALLKFVADVTRPGSPAFVPPEERVAVFDNDGTLWSEQPLYFQFFFLLDQVRAAAPQHPEWRSNPAFKALMANDLQGLMRDEKALATLEHFGWQLRFVRRPLFQAPIPVLFDRNGGRFVVLEPDGSIDENPSLTLRG